MKSKILIVFPHPGYNKSTLMQLLPQAKLSINLVSVKCIAQMRPPGDNFSTFYEDQKTCLFPNPILRGWIDSFKRDVEEIKPNIILAFGEEVMHLLTGYKGIEKFRGYIMQTNIWPEESNYKIITTYDLERLRYEHHQQYTILMDIRKALRNSETPKLRLEDRAFIPDASPDEFIDYCKFLLRLPHSGEYPDPEAVDSGVALDIENTIGHGCHLTHFGIGHSLNFAMTIKFLRGNAPALSQSEEILILQWIARLSEAEHLKWIMHNGSHDISILWMNQHILFPIYYDTMLAAQLLWPELRKSLGFLASICLDVPPWKHVSGEENYNPQDVANTKGIFYTIFKEIQIRGMEQIQKFEIAQLPIAIMMGLQGVKIDTTEKEKLRLSYIKREKELREELDHLSAPFGKFNYSSPKQLQELLYKHMGLPPQYKRRKSAKEVRKLTTDAESLTKLAQKTNSPVPKLLIEIKQVKKAISSYLSFEVSDKGTIHTTYNIGSAIERFKLKLGAEDNKSLGRWSSSKNIILPYGPGNLQAIPSYARSMVVPFEKGHKIGCGDYVQAEAVLVAHLSNNEVLINQINRGYELRREQEELFKTFVKFKDSINFDLKPYEESKARIELELQKVDIHRIKASEIFEIPVLEITKEQRQLGKVLRHSRNYNAGPAVLQAQAAKAGIYLELSYCKRLMDIDDRKSPYLGRWHQSIKKELAEHGKTLSNPFGRKRRFLGAWNEDLWKRGFAFKPQSTIGDLLNASMTEFYEKWGDIYRLLLQLHDGLYISYPEEEELTALRRLRKSMIRPIEINGREVIIDVDFKSGYNWKDLEEVIVYE